MAYHYCELLYHDKLQHIESLPIELSAWYLEHTCSDGGSIESVDVIDASGKRLSTFFCDCEDFAVDTKLRMLEASKDDTRSLFASISQYLYNNNFKGFTALTALLMACFPAKKRTHKRPLLLIDRRSDISQSLAELLPVTVSSKEKCICSVRTMHLRICSVCGLARSHCDMIRCLDCQVMLYCSKTCLEAADMGSDSHDAFCGKLKSLHEKSFELDSHPFTFNTAVTSDEFDNEELVAFLKHEGVYNLGMWVRETPHCSLCDISISPYGELDLSLDPYVLPIEGAILESRTSAPTERLTSWEDYFSWRGFCMSSPISMLMHYCLTVYHIINTGNPSLNSPSLSFSRELSNLSQQESLSIVLAGVDKEADFIQTFVELSSLLPNLKLKLTLVGPLVSKHVSNTRTSVYSNDTLEIYLYNGLVQDICQPSDLVICMNAGLSAYSTWKYAILKFSEFRLTCFITDFCLLSLQSSKQAVNNVCGLDVVLEEPVVNPFHSPFRKYSESTNMHWYSNAYISQLHYGFHDQLV